MHEVASPLVHRLVEAAGHAGIDDARAFAGLEAAEQARAGIRRIRWTLFVDFVAAIEQGCGGADRLAGLAEAAVRASPESAALAASFDQPMEFYRFAAALCAPAFVPALRAEFEPQSNHRYRLRIEVASPHPSAPSVLRLLGAVLRALPTAFGHPVAEVESDIEERKAVYQVRLARAKASRRRAARREPSHAGAIAAAGAALEHALAEQLAARDALAAARAELGDRAQRGATLHALATELATRGGLAELGASLARALRAPPFAFDYVALSTVDHGAAHAVIQVGKVPPGAELRAHPLRVGDRELARLDVAGVAGVSRPDALEDAVPWLALAVDRAALQQALRDLPPRSSAGDRTPSDEVLHRRLLRATEAWHLTPRQVECVERLVRGRSNREIAAEILCTERTVEAHLAVAFRRAGVRARSSLVARFWSEPW